MGPLESFKVGSVVRLKSGSPKMTITNIGGSLGNEARVSWFDDDGKLAAGTFPLDALELDEE